MRSGSKLEGARVLITGAASGIGRQLARDLFFRKGACLHLLDRDAEQLESLQRELTGAHDATSGPAPSVIIHTCDITSRSEIEAVVEAIGQEPLDLLINNAGVFYAGPFETMSVDDFEEVIQINFLGAVRLTRQLLPNLLRGPNSTIVNVASMAGLVAAPGMCAYAASKFALVGFSEALRSELAGRVHVCTVCPAFVKTQFAEHAIVDSKMEPDVRQQRIGAMETFLEKVGATPAKASAEIIRAVENRRKLVLITADAGALYYLKRFLPGITESLLLSAHQRLLRRGIVWRS